MSTDFDEVADFANIHSENQFIDTLAKHDPSGPIAAMLAELSDEYAAQPRTAVRWSNGSLYPRDETPTAAWLKEHELLLALHARWTVRELNAFSQSSPMCDHSNMKDCSPECVDDHCLMVLGVENLSVCKLPPDVDRVHVRVAFLEAIIAWLLKDALWHLTPLYDEDGEPFDTDSTDETPDER